MFILIYCGCNYSKTSNQITLVENEELTSIQTHDTLEGNAVNQFSLEKINSLGDSIISYFQTKDRSIIESYETTVDTIKNQDYTKITIRILTNTYKTNGLISYDIFTFPNKEYASSFFNDLKTQELINPFGINKRPNHILIDSNQVYWHHLEHSYGHRIKDLTQIFNHIFNFHPQSTNLDSISGFTYCNCINEDAKNRGIKGKWIISDSVQIKTKHSENQYHSNCKITILNNSEIIFKDDSISINENSMPIEVNSSFKLPDNSLFWKYYFSEIEKQEFTDEFNDKLKIIDKSQESLIIYKIDLAKYFNFTCVRLKKGKFYLIFQNNLYTLT